MLPAAWSCYHRRVSEFDLQRLPTTVATADKETSSALAAPAKTGSLRSWSVKLGFIAVGFVTGTMGAVACLMRCMADGGLPAEDMNRALVSVMGKALGKPELGDGSCFRCAGNGRIVSAQSSAVCGVCRGTGRLVVGS